ncbi:hypothetical protein BPO_p0011 (plasmid) [Bergeyella porcorum]|uniref:Uncharacterized protein n=1 Tax=Bergeyella porcorum TaxID=1735111 RepID=A0AAU0F2V0_9FLAO
MLQENASNTGVFIPIIFERNGYELVRNMFVINKMIINKNSILISIPEWLFEKITSKGKAELYQYYLNEKKHRISLSEINLSNNMYYTREKIETAGITGTEPETRLSIKKTTIVRTMWFKIVTLLKENHFCNTKIQNSNE